MLEIREYKLSLEYTPKRCSTIVTIDIVLLTDSPALSGGE